MKRKKGESGAARAGTAVGGSSHKLKSEGPTGTFLKSSTLAGRDRVEYQSKQGERKKDLWGERPEGGPSITSSWTPPEEGQKKRGGGKSSVLLQGKGALIVQSVLGIVEANPGLQGVGDAKKRRYGI